jgi:drug/metabolite transporter (DMT)-like permease
MKGHFPVRALLAMAAALALWASAFAGIRAGLHAYAPGQLAVLRFVVASLVLVAYAGLAHFRRPEGRDAPGMFLAGIVGISFYNLALNFGETRVSAGTASLLIASVPIWTVLFAGFALHERIAPRAWVGVLICSAGVALIACGEGKGIHF